MNPEENIETENIKDEREFTDEGEQQALPPQPKIERVKKDLPKKKWRKQGLRKSTRKRK